MPTLRTPLFGSYNNRAFSSVSGKDQLFKGCLLTPVINQQSRSATYYVEKRAGFLSSATISSGKIAYGCYQAKGNTTFTVVTAFSNAGGGIDIFANSTNCGTISATTKQNISFSEEVLGGISYILITASIGPVGTAGATGWYLASDSYANTAYTCDGNNSTTITDLKAGGVPSVAGLYVGQKLAAASNIVAGSRIVSINAGAFSVVLDTATTGGAFNDLATTKEPIAKQVDPDFPANAGEIIVGAFAALNGYISILTLSGKLFTSDLNSVSSWTAGSYLTCSQYASIGVTAARYKSRIVCFTNASIEFFYNAGNASGSPFSASQEAIGTSSIPPSYFSQCSAEEERLYWIGADSNVYKMNGFSPQIICPMPCTIKQVNATPQLLFLAVVGAFQYLRRSYLNCSTYDDYLKIRNYLIDVDSGTIVEIGIEDYPIYLTNTLGFVYASYGNSGKYFFWQDSSSTTFQDNGVAIPFSIQIQTDMGTSKRKKCQELRLICDVQSTGAISVSYSDDDGATFSTPVSMPVTAFNLMKITNLGSWYGRRLWKFEDSGNNAQRIEMLEIDYTVEA